MLVQFVQILASLALLPLVLTRCQQPSNPNTFPSIESSKPIYDAAQEHNINAVEIKFRVSARRLTGRNRSNKMVRIDPFPRIYIDGNSQEVDDKTCFIKETQNPNFSQEFTVFYDESKRTYLEIEIRDNVDGGNDFSIGRSFFHVRNMLCVGRQIESPLWNHLNTENGSVDELNTGVVLVTTISVKDTLIINCD